MHPIKKFCKERKLTQKELAASAYISAPYLTQIVKGQRRPTPPVALRIQQATGGKVGVLELLYPKDEAA